MLYERLVLMHELLSEDGSFYVHLAPNVSHTVKLVLDEIFGPTQFRSELIWKRTGAHGAAKRFAPVHDVILYYAKSATPTWNPLFHDYSDKYLTTKYRYEDERGFRPGRDVTG